MALCSINNNIKQTVKKYEIELPTNHQNKRWHLDDAALPQHKIKKHQQRNISKTIKNYQIEIPPNHQKECLDLNDAASHHPKINNHEPKS